MPQQLEELKKLGRYQLIRPLGNGGMATVYLAKDTELNRQVAIKCFPVEPYDKSQIENLQREAVLLAQLNHPNVVQMHDVVIDNGHLGLIMEYVQGLTLADKLKQQLPDRKKAISCLIQIADGLDAAHQKGIIHCDLKMDNILVTTCPNTDSIVLKISDLGIAETELSIKSPDGKSKSEPIFGSYLSLSPEQAQGKKVDFRTDIFSFGLIAYQLLTGRHPFGKTNNSDTMVQRISNERFEFSAVDKSLLSPELLALISALLENNPNDRPANIGFVANTLRYISQLLAEERSEEQRLLDPSTMVINTQPPPPFWRTKKLRNLAYSLVLAGLLTAMYLIQSTPPETNYIAILNADIETTEGFDPEQKRLITTTLESAKQEAIINDPYLALIPNSNLEDFDNDIASFAQAVAADTILNSQISCDPEQCQINLQKLQKNQGSGNWMVTNQRSWPVLTQSLSDIRSTTLNQFSMLFATHSNSNKRTISEAAYRQYLLTYQSSSAGTIPTDEHLAQLEAIQSQAQAFIPIYQLYRFIASNLYTYSGDQTYIDQLGNFLQRAPTSLKQTQEYIEIKFYIALRNDDVSEAQQLIEQLESTSADRVLINDIESRLAYHTSNYDAAADLERKSLMLRPTAFRHYNLAVTDFTLGNLDEALTSVNKALELKPNDIESLGLVSAIALTKGKLKQAISSYQSLVENEPNSHNLSNLGLAYMLDGSFELAIQTFTKAKALNPDHIQMIISLADSYILSGKINLAKQLYQQIVEQTKENKDATSYNFRAQAFAHLGQYNLAIKTLKEAERLFDSNAELDYSAAIVHTLAGNHSAAIVDIENAISNGMGAIWFHLNWFKTLCSYPLFNTLTKLDTKEYCQSGHNN